MPMPPRIAFGLINYLFPTHGEIFPPTPRIEDSHADATAAGS